MRQTAVQRDFSRRRCYRGGAGKPEGGERRRRLLPAMPVVPEPRADGAARARWARRLAAARLARLAAGPTVEQPPEVFERQQVHVDACEDAFAHEVLELRGVQILDLFFRDAVHAGDL